MHTKKVRMNRSLRRVAIIGLAAAATTTLACDEHVDCPADPPMIGMFTSDPTTGAAGDTLDLMIMVENFELTGHMHADGGTADDHHASDCAGGVLHIYWDDLVSNPLAMPTTHMVEIMIPDDATVGDHTLIARLHNRDHTILEPQVTSELTITVE